MAQPQALASSLDSAGNLYGVTALGGLQSNGVAYELTPAGNGTWNETILYNFGAAGDGSQPSGDLIFDASGKLYGTTEIGGSLKRGTVFRLTPGAGGWTETTLYDFSASNDGLVPTGVILDTAGNLFGVARYGGLFGMGRAYELSPATGSWQETVIHDFTGGSDGYYPAGKLVSDSRRNLYGVAVGGGLHGLGTAYQFSPGKGGGWNGKILHQFPQTSFDGFYPDSGPILDGSGNLYGVTQQGGNGGIGVAYRLTPN